MASLKDIDSIYIENGSTNIDVVSAEIEELEAYLLLYDNGPGIVMEKGQQKLTIRLKNDISRLFKIDRMPHLEVRVPTEFKGEIIVRALLVMSLVRICKRTISKLMVAVVT